MRVHTYMYIYIYLLGWSYEFWKNWFPFYLIERRRSVTFGSRRMKCGSEMSALCVRYTSAKLYSRLTIRLKSMSEILIHGSRIESTSAWAPRMDRLAWRCVIRASLRVYACVEERRVRECVKTWESSKRVCSTYNIRYIMYIVLYITNESLTVYNTTQIYLYFMLKIILVKDSSFCYSDTTYTFPTIILSKIILLYFRSCYIKILINKSLERN